MNRRITEAAAAMSLTLATSVAVAAPKPMINYFQPMPIVGQLSSSVWGASTVGPRDPGNGLEDDKAYFYWDGKIISGNDGKYHLYCSHWAHDTGFNNWGHSVPMHATSDNVMGPYVYQANAYAKNNGQGHNTTAIVQPDGTYALIESEIVPGWIFTARSPDGPWTFQAAITTDNNGFAANSLTSNLTVTIGPDGRFWATSRHGFIMSSDKIAGTYKVVTNSVYPAISGMNQSRAEDPVIWYSGGYFHVVYNYWDTRKAYHLMSKDGVHNWTNTGVAADPTADFVRYTNGTVNHWYNMERPGVFMENGHVTHFTFAVTDVSKDSASMINNGGSKILVIPFDGASFDADNGGDTGGSAGSGGGPGRGGAGGAGGSTGATGGGGRGGRGGRAGVDGGSDDAAVGGGPRDAGSSETGGVSGAGGGAGSSAGAGGRFGLAAGGAGISAGEGGSVSSGVAGHTGSSGATGVANPESGCSCSAVGGQRQSALASLLLLGLWAVTLARRTMVRRREESIRNRHPF